MREAILAAMPILVWVLAALNLFLLILIFKEYGKNKYNKPICRKFLFRRILNNINRR